MYPKSDTESESDKLDSAYANLVKPIIKDSNNDEKPKIFVGIVEDGYSSEPAYFSETNYKWNGLRKISDIQYLVVEYPKTLKEAQHREPYTFGNGKLQPPAEFKSSDIRGMYLTEKEFLSKERYNEEHLKDFKATYTMYYTIIGCQMLLVIICVIIIKTRFKQPLKGEVKKL